MSYLIRFLLISFCLLLASEMSAQVDGTIVTIRCAALESDAPSSIKFSFKFKQNSTSCGPGALFETVDQQIAYFQNSLREEGIDFADFTELNPIQVNESSYRELDFSRKFTYHSSDEVLLKKIFLLAKDSFAEELNFHYVYEQRSLESQDAHAIAALKNGMDRAEKIKTVLGMTSSELLSIDDATSGSTSGVAYGFFSAHRYPEPNAGDGVSKFRARNYYLQLNFLMK